MSNNFEATSPPAPLTPEPASNTPAFPAVPRRNWLTPTLTLLAVLVIGVFGGVLIGHATASSAQASNLGGLSRGSNAATGGAGCTSFAGGGLTSGTIVSLTGTKMVLTAQDGTTKNIRTSSTTRVSATTTTTLSALKVGQKVTVVGATGSTGDITATSVSEGARGFGARPGGADGSPAPGSISGTNG